MEGEGKKGGNNISSLLLKTLRLLSFMQEGNQGKELNVVFDNCGGQNKNTFVLLMVPYLVEMGYFKSVNFIFIVVGHTKNAGDRLFNLLKMIYRRSNVQTFGSLLGVCGKSPHVTPTRCDKYSAKCKTRRYPPQCRKPALELWKNLKL
jgi:hypothetical protein